MRVVAALARVVASSRVAAGTAKIYHTKPMNSIKPY